MSDLNEIFNEFARAFVGTVTSDREIAFPHELQRDSLDGTLESLLIVDQYLKYVHLHRRKVDPLAWDTTVLWGGAYVGEVIRHAREDEFRWIDYNEYIEQRPDLRWMIPERTVATCGLLIGPYDSMSMPLNKIARFIEDGPENSVHFFAVCDLNKRRETNRS
jgi:hypothetical protein